MLLEMIFGVTFFVLPVIGMFVMLILTAMRKGKQEDEKASIKEPLVQQKPFVQQELMKRSVVPFRKKDLPTYSLHNLEKEDKYIGKRIFREDTS